MYPEGVAAYGALTLCDGYQCGYKSEACGGNSPDLCAGKCLYDTCLSTFSACESDPSCYQLFICAAGCDLSAGIEVCVAGCNTTYPATVAGDNLFKALEMCTTACPCGAPTRAPAELTGGRGAGVAPR